MFEQATDALEWLQDKSQHRFIYALLRSGRLFLHQESHLFQACVELAQLLRDEVETVRQLLYHHNWRYSVIGNIVVVLNRDSHYYEEDYAHKLISGRVCFPEPFAAAWLIIQKQNTIPKMEAYLLEVGKRKDVDMESVPYGTTLAIYAALQILENIHAKNFESTETFRVLSNSNYFPRSVESTQNNYFAYLRYEPNS